MAPAPPNEHAMIEKGSREFRRYWRAWYSLKLPLGGRHPLHAELGLPESHTAFSAADLDAWEASCAKMRREQIVALIRTKGANLAPEARKMANAAVAAKYELPAGATMDTLTERQLREVLRYLSGL